jgi:serine/threonine-protein kinase
MAEFTKLGKYEIRGELGRGAMGVVYEAYDPLIERVVALKTIRPEALLGAQAAEIMARFRREAQAAGKLTHPNIVGIYEFGEDAGVWYIAMELVKGRELKDYFEKHERFATVDVVRILTQVLSALGYSHKLGVVHRDIKPSNVFMLPDGTAKVADFGIAHVDSSQLTQVGSVLGTPAYMSPEQILGLPVDGRSDLFSVGVILYQFLTGERPFVGNATVTMRKVLEEDPLPPSRFNMQITGAMDSVVRRALAKKADDRFQTAEEFVQALVDAAAAKPVKTADATAMPTHAAAASATPSTPKPAAPARQSQAAAIAVVGGIFAIAAVAGIWYVVQGRAGQEPAAVVAKVTPKVAPPEAAPAAPVSPPPPTPAPAPQAAPAPTEPGAVVISAVGLVDTSDSRYQSDKGLMQADLRADSRSQLVEKAVAMLVEKKSLAKNYDVVRDKLLSRSGDFVTTVVREGAPETGKDGLASLTTEAVVNVKAVQKSLNEMSRNERVEFIRASGDPRVAVRIVTRDADRPDAAAQPSPAAENILKDRIKSFGFRTWSEEAPRDGAGTPDFVVEGEATIKRLSMKLAASGLTVTKYGLNSWTIKCIDRTTGEEIYYNTKLPTGQGSWASEAEALKAIGTSIANEFSRDFFLAHVTVSGRRVSLRFDGLPPSVTDEALRREMIAMPSVLNVTGGDQRRFDLQIAGNGPPGDIVMAGILGPLNAKLGQSCFALGGVDGDKVAATFDAKCDDASTLARLETNPPAALYNAPAQRQKAIVKNPDTLKKLLI